MKKLKIVIIDDEPAVLFSLQEFLTEKGYSVYSARDGAKGLAIIDKKKIDLVITDLLMPVMNGFEIIKHLKEREPELPLIAISGIGGIENAVKAIRLGAWDYITKPIKNFAEIELITGQALEKARLKQENKNYKEKLEQLLKKKSAELIKNEARYRIAESIAHLGNWEWTFKKNKIWTSGEFLQILAVNRFPEGNFLDNLLTFVDTADQPRVQRFFKAAVKNKENFEIEFSIKTAANKVKNLFSICRPIINVQKKVIALHGTIQDISKQKKAEKERDCLINILEKKNTELENFTYSVSHDLRSPLITAKGFAELLEDDIKNNHGEALQENLYYINTALHKMSQLIDKLLNLSRIGRLNNKFSTIKTEQLIKQTLDILQKEISRTGATVNITTKLPTIYGDAQQVGEVFQNLISNALRYKNPARSPVIEIGHCRKNKRNCFFIKDNGIGIEPRHYQRVFNMFEKLANNENASGMGLAIVKKIIENHNGEIWLKSKGKNKGTVFYFIFNSRNEQKEL
ncbi:MAG TPA: response regulator [Spirochaetota bacterium]|nr:response regulator [Spirochaetota bacterium]